VTWALVPVKAFGRGKSRLSTALSEADRAAFARGLLEHVLDTLAVSHLDGILVATDSSEVAETARQRATRICWDAPDALNLAAVVDRGLLELSAFGARSALVLMADLPAIEPDDVHAVLALLAEHDVVVVPAADGFHTNALALSPPTCLRTAFGRADSFQAHLAVARSTHLRTAVFDHPRLAFDVDGPADLARFKALSHRIESADRG